VAIGVSVEGGESLKYRGVRGRFGMCGTGGRWVRVLGSGYSTGYSAGDN